MMKNHWLKFLAAYTIPISVLISMMLGGYASYFSVVYLFGLIPVVELFMKGSTENLSAVEEEIAKEDKRYDWVLYSMVPIQYALMIFFLYRIGDAELASYERTGIILSFGMACGSLGINVAHELGHRNTRHEQLMSKLLLLTSLYLHFFIEHNRGHHKHVSTDKDPASSRFGEWIYTFWFRSVIGGWLSAWKLEFDRLKKKGIPVVSLHNEMLVFQLIQLGFLGLIYLFFGAQIMLYFIFAATIGFLLLETVNYIEHYGLRRKKKGNRYERTLPVHSWNSNHPIGRLMLFELSRHSDHHFIASRKYQTLRNFEESPQMPTGYPGMMLLALVPPLWFQVMHRKINQYRSTHLGEALG